MSDDIPTQAWQRTPGKLNISELPDMEALAAEAYYTDAKGKEPYGDVPYADNGLQPDGKKRYPIDTPAHIRSAWNYIHKPHNASQYTPSQVSSIKSKIVAAWKKHIDPKGPPEAKKS